MMNQAMKRDLKNSDWAQISDRMHPYYECLQQCAKFAVMVSAASFMLSLGPLLPGYSLCLRWPSLTSVFVQSCSDLCELCG